MRQELQLLLQRFLHKKEEIKWNMYTVHYAVVIINWNDFRNVWLKVDSFSFGGAERDRGWHDMVTWRDLQ